MKNQAKLNNDTTALKIKSEELSPEMERRMRLIANLIIDRIFEDKRTNILSFQSGSSQNRNSHVRNK